MSEKQMVMNTMTLPLNEDFRAVSMAVSQLLSEGWEWQGITKDEIGIFFIELQRCFEYEPVSLDRRDERAAPSAPESRNT